MGLQLIGAGLPRTGTMSLKLALERLLGAPCYHMIELLQEHPEHFTVWADAFEGRPPDWDAFLAPYAAGVDMPLAARWEELAALYPDAPVLLSQRESPQAWWRSMDRTVLAQMRRMRDAGPGPDAPPDMGRAMSQMMSDVVTDPDDAESVMAGYQRHLDHVRATVPAHRLVEWQPGDGWEPLCAALGVPVPGEGFPHENTTADFQERAAERRED